MSTPFSNTRFPYAIINTHGEVIARCGTFMRAKMRARVALSEKIVGLDDGYNPKLGEICDALRCKFTEVEP